MTTSRNQHGLNRSCILSKDLYTTFQDPEFSCVAGACGVHGEDEKYLQILIGKPQGRRLPGRPRHRWEVNIKMDLWETGLEGAE
jgi:hypothetical protein